MTRPTLHLMPVRQYDQPNYTAIVTETDVIHIQWRRPDGAVLQSLVVAPVHLAPLMPIPADLDVWASKDGRTWHHMYEVRGGVVRDVKP